MVPKLQDGRSSRPYLPRILVATIQEFGPGLYWHAYGALLSRQPGCDSKNVDTLNAGGRLLKSAPGPATLASKQVKRAQEKLRRPLMAERLGSHAASSYLAEPCQSRLPACVTGSPALPCS